MVWNEFVGPMVHFIPKWLNPYNDINVSDNLTTFAHLS